MKKKIITLLFAVFLLTIIAPLRAKAAVEGNDHITFSSTGKFSIFAAKGWTGIVEYSTNGSDWSTWNGSSVSAVQQYGTYYLCLRGSGNSVITNGYAGRWILTASANVNCTGNIMTLLNHSNPDTAVMGENCFHSLFRDWTKLITAPTLPATTLSRDCYCGMFRGCRGLTIAPLLPANTLANSCYSGMFQECVSLQVPPALPAEKLASFCYDSMFYKCTRLSEAPKLPAKYLQAACYQSMFRDCEYLSTPPELPAKDLADSCYQTMFCGCIKLKTVPELPATTLQNSCYKSMFDGCLSLKLYSCNTAGVTTGAWSVPSGAYSSSTTATNWNTDMFKNTGGDIPVSPAPGSVYHYANPLFPHIDSSNFPDEAFRTYIKDSFDTNHDSFLSAEELAAATTINVYNKGISSLTGIRYFTELTKLTCSHNSITALDLSNNTKLETLYCEYNQIDALDLLANKDLKNLACDHNQLGMLNISNNPKLEYLDCSDNHIPALDLSKSIALSFLICSGNDITTLDISHCPQLSKELVEADDKVTIYDLAAPSGVKAASASVSSLKLSWKKTSGASGYEIYRATAKTGTYKKVKRIAGASTVTYTNSSLATGKTYYYRIRAYHTVNGSSNYSPYSSIVSAKPVPGKPSLTVKKAASRKIRLSWKRVAGASGYVIQRASSKTGKYKTIKTIKKGTTRSYTNTKLKKGKKYYYRIRAYKTVNKTRVYGAYSTVKYAKA